MALCVLEARLAEEEAALRLVMDVARLRGGAVLPASPCLLRVLGVGIRE